VAEKKNVLDTEILVFYTNIGGRHENYGML